jgi:hypothetical protein
MMWTWSRQATRAAGCLLLSSATVACGPAGLDFRQDHRLSIVAPEGVPTVHLPLAVRWRFLGSLGAADGPDGFAVFIDRAPMAPGESLTSLDRDERRAVTVTRATDTTVSNIDTATAGRSEHQVTVVLLDKSQRRIGETSVAVHFYVQGSQ